MEILAVHNVYFDYAAKPVLQDISFSVRTGTICGLLGPNASGKTTLLKCINGVLKPNRGRILIDGQPLNNLSRKTIAGLMAVVPQISSVAFAFTALQMVVMGRASHLGAMGTPSRRDYQEAEKILTELGLAHLKDRAFNHLSGGERQMVLLARAICQRPRILLLDEPTSHLDFKNQYHILDTVLMLTRTRNLTTLITLHDPNLAARYCNRMVMIKQGRVHRKGDVAAVFERQVLESMYGIAIRIANDGLGKCFVMPASDSRPAQPL